MAKCYQCGEENSFFCRFKINVDNNIFIACSHCGRELVSREKLLFLFLFEGIFMLISMIAVSYFNWGAFGYFIAFILIVSSFYLLIPFKKE